MLTGLISGLLVVFVAWLARNIFLARRLFLIQPKLFDYSDLVQPRNSKTVELTAFNGGLRPEEDVRIQLSPSFHYTIIASDAAGLTVDDQGILRIDRLVPKQDRTVILTAEGGEFRKEHVVGIASKETVGKIRDKLQEAQFSPLQHLAIIFVLFILLPGLGYGAGKIIEEDFWPEVSAKISKGESVAFAVKNLEIQAISAPKEMAKTYANNYSIKTVTRRGDLVSITTELTNKTSNKLQFTLVSSTPVSEKRGFNSDYIVANVLVFPGAEKVIDVTDYLPKDVQPNILSFEVTIDGSSGRAVFTQDVDLTGS